VTYPVPQPPHAQPQPAPHPPGGHPAKPGRPGRGRWLPIAVIAVAASAAVVMSGIALARHPGPSALASSPAPTGSSSSPGDVAAAKKTACDAWAAAAPAINAARHPFVSAPDNWNDPVTVSALVQAQAGILIQVEYLRQHVGPATPAEVAGPIADYVAAAIDTAAADGQHQSAEVANTAAARSSAAATKIRAACGL